ncbi:MAG TPA: class I SAM-dependent methyltransferase [Candidatus Elarobacter sp.]|jgi:ubiquinone/menaquinone biosynthesis C-methylase UbiE
MSVRALRGKSVIEISDPDLAARLDGYSRIVLDLGAGDAKAALRLAREQPETLVIAADATPDAMQAQAVRSLRKPSRGGAGNIVFLIGDVAALPHALDRRVAEVTVTLPWASLLRAVVLGEDAFTGAVRRVLRDGGRLTVVLNLDALQQRIPREYADLPRVDAAYARTTLAARFSAHGLHVDDVRELEEPEKRELGSAWAKRLTRTRKPAFLIVTAFAGPAA